MLVDFVSRAASSTQVFDQDFAFTMPDAQQADLVLTYKGFLVRLHQANRSCYSFHHIQPEFIHERVIVISL